MMTDAERGTVSARLLAVAAGRFVVLVEQCRTHFSFLRDFPFGVILDVVKIIEIRSEANFRCLGAEEPMPEEIRRLVLDLKLRKPSARVRTVGDTIGR